MKIADFGLAKKLEESGGDSMPALTMTNVAVGTPDFVAPEALDSDQKPVHRADLYAVGVMLYQMLTGKLPRGQFKSPSELDPAIDPRLDGIVSKAMQAHPDDRYSSASLVRADLDVIFSQPFAKVEAGEESAVVAAVVPVTTSVKGRPPRESRKIYPGSPGTVQATGVSRRWCRRRGARGPGCHGNVGETGSGPGGGVTVENGGNSARVSIRAQGPGGR